MQTFECLFQKNSWHLAHWQTEYIERYKPYGSFMSTAASEQLRVTTLHDVSLHMFDPWYINYSTVPFVIVCPSGCG